MMDEARVRRAATQSTLKSDPSGLQTHDLRKKKSETIKETQAALAANSDLPRVSEPPPAKKQKFILTKPTRIIDHIVSIVMQETGQGIRQSHPDPQLNF